MDNCPKCGVGGSCSLAGSLGVWQTVFACKSTHTVSWNEGEPDRFHQSLECRIRELEQQFERMRADRDALLVACESWIVYVRAAGQDVVNVPLLRNAMAASVELTEYAIAKARGDFENANAAQAGG